MASVRREETSPEIAVRLVLDEIGINKDTNVRGLPGTPDIVALDSNTPIFVHGCFWHRHQGCRHATTPKSNTEYWIPKLLENERRDRRIMEQLKADGFRPVVVWQCETRDVPRLKRRLSRLLKGRRVS